MSVIFLIVFLKICFVSYALLIDKTNQEGFILIVKSNSVVQFMIENGLYKEYRLDKFNATVSVDVDMKHNCLFWYNDHDNKFYRNCPTISGERISTPLFWSLPSYSLAYDWMSETLYFSLQDQRKIEMVKIIDSGDPMASSTIRCKVIETKSTARKVAVHPKRGYLFWTEYENGTNAMISRSNLDGTGVRVLLRHPKISAPNVIAVDYDDDKIFWADLNFGYIGSSDINGRIVLTIFRAHDHYLLTNAISVRGGLLFWHNWLNSSTIYYTEKGKIMIIIILYYLY